MIWPDRFFIYWKKTKNSIDRKKEEDRMKLVGISILFIVLWLVVCMPELNSVSQSTKEGFKIYIQFW